MTKLEALKKQFKTAFKRLEEVLVLKNEKDNVVRDSAVQRFEFTFDLSWKLFKEILANQGIQCTSPKSCIREAYKQGLIEYENFWLEMIEMRNLTSHTYNESTAKEIYKKLPKTLPLFKVMTKRS